MPIKPHANIQHAIHFSDLTLFILRYYPLNVMKV